MSKHKRLLRLAKLIGGGVDHWACPWEPGDYEQHIADGIEQLQKTGAWYNRVRKMIGDWYESRVGSPMTGHEADAITVMEARWRNDREEIKQLRDTLREVQWMTITKGAGMSAWLTCVGCGISLHGSLSTPPHKAGCVIEAALWQKPGEE